MAGPDAHVYAPAEGHRLRHDPFNSIVAPRPIGWVSTISADGAVNLAPYSFFNGFNYTPPIIGFSSIGWKDSVRNASETRQFCWNLATAPLAPQMNLTCAPAPPEVDEFDVAGLTRAPARLVAPPRVLESPVNFECEVTQIVQLARADGQTVPAWLVLGEVVMVHIDQAALVEGVFDTLGVQPIMRGGGLGDYFGISAPDKFQMRRPDWPIAR
ncbi:MAG TPA: flavin reductase family protein [Caulobacteraceae bacterium]|jgi:flavin reductase (DIM6/NTAB) family NADH-FMN oxidoreductase RutF|nr:flavin reductase family protein [Caulobacteraceae bacterium]